MTSTEAVAAAAPRRGDFVFTYNWDVAFPEADGFHSSLDSPHFLTSISHLTHVNYLWRLRLVSNRGGDLMDGQGAPGDSLGIRLEYVDGPSLCLRFQATFSAQKPNREAKTVVCEASVELQGSFGFVTFLPKRASELRRFGFVSDGDSTLRLSVLLRLPAELFAVQRIIGEAPALRRSHTAASLNRKLFESILDKESAQWSDFVVESKDGREFYCHRAVLGLGCEEYFGSLLRSSGCKEACEGRLCCGAYSGPVLELVLESIYLGRSSEERLGSLETAELWEVAEAARYFLLPSLAAQTQGALGERLLRPAADAATFPAHLAAARQHHFHCLANLLLNAVALNAKKADTTMELPADLRSCLARLSQAQLLVPKPTAAK